MKLIKYAILSLLCCFLLAGCVETDFVSTSTQADSEYSETAKNDKKTKKKKSGKKGKSKTKKTKKKKKKSEKSTNESKIIERAKETVNIEGYTYLTQTTDITYEKVLDYVFDSTQWIQINNDDFEGVEFIGIQDGWLEKREIHFYYDANRMKWEEEFSYFVNGVEDIQYEEDNTHSELMFVFYMMYCTDNKIDVNE